jgi:hypothetical protein
MTTHLSSHVLPADARFDSFDLPALIVLDLADLVKTFEFQWNEILRVDQSRDISFKPDVGRVIKQVIESVRNEIDAELDVSIMAYHDIAAVSHYSISAFGHTEFYNRLHLELATTTVEFGKAVVRRLRQDRVYHRGYLPYKFVAWVGSTVALGLDQPQLYPRLPEYQAHLPDYQENQP